MTTPTNYSTFYTPPSPLPAGAAGYIIKQEASNLATMVVKIPAKATRVMYKSTDSLGNPNAVTGTYFEPTAAWAGVGPRPLVAFAPATMGAGDQCAPSRLFNQVIYCGGQKNFMAEYQAGNVKAKVEKGIAVFVTDYENVGTSFATGKQNTFANRKAQAKALIDGAKAAFNVSGTTLTSGSKVVLWGYSQGAGAAGAAAELLHSYDSSFEAKVVGACLNSPPANLFNLIYSLDKNMLAGVVAWLISGFKVSYPGNLSAINAALTPLGQSWLVNSQQMCMVESAMTYGFNPLAPLFTDCKTVDDIIRLINTAPFYTMINDQCLGSVAPTKPCLVSVNPSDPLVDPGDAQILSQKWTALGSDVQFYTSAVQVPTLGLQKTSLIHFLSAQTDDPVALQWIMDRFNGVVTSPNGDSIGVMHGATASLAMTVTATATASKS